MPRHDVDASRNALLAIYSFYLYIVRALCYFLFFLLYFLRTSRGGGASRLSLFVPFSRQTTSGIGHPIVYLDRLMKMGSESHQRDYAQETDLVRGAVAAWRARA